MRERSSSRRDTEDGGRIRGPEMGEVEQKERYLQAGRGGTELGFQVEPERGARCSQARATAMGEGGSRS